jgi:hypothetical protein
MALALTSDEIIELQLDVAAQRPSKLKTPEAVAMREKLQAHYDWCKKNGKTFEIVAEHEDISEG